MTESIERFIEDQASCGRMIRLLAHPLPPSTVSKFFSLFQSSCVSPIELTDGRRWGVGEEPNNTTSRKPDPL
jgi:hypothetical protein